MPQAKFFENWYFLMPKEAPLTNSSRGALRISGGASTPLRDGGVQNHAADTYYEYNESDEEEAFYNDHRKSTQFEKIRYFSKNYYQNNIGSRIKLHSTKYPLKK